MQRALEAEEEDEDEDSEEEFDVVSESFPGRYECFTSMSCPVRAWRKGDCG